jgi:C_GCAxxG_C_C family probable redox protein
MTAKADVAVEKFFAGYNCAQSVLYSLCDDLHFDRDTALRLACGFGGGMGGKQEVCGALSGGILAIGFQHGRGEGQDKKLTDETYLKVRELMSRFESLHGTCICSKLLGGCNPTTPEGQQYFKEKDLKNTICKGCVKSVVEMLEHIL